MKKVIYYLRLAIVLLIENSEGLLHKGIEALTRLIDPREIPIIEEKAKEDIK